MLRGWLICGMRFRWWTSLLASLACVLCPAAETNRPPVHLLVPGFTVQELPVKLSNQNNLRFAPDGTLTSLGYDGRIWRLRDTNGDGLEDTADPFWDQPTLSVPLGMAWSTDGLYVSSKGKVSLLRDTDADGRADTEVIVASDWPATDVGSGGVDATAVTLDPEGNLYFGLLVADYSNPYRLRPRRDLKPAEIDWLKQSGRWKEPAGPDAANDTFSLYDLNSRRGTIQKFNPRTKTLETVASGLRVPVALAFNLAGDLFNTDQEGETWIPHGNPLDELNHIIPGRNYGFPPRHEIWLPDLSSEPPVVAFGPQHQSACGLVFNEPRRKSEAGRSKPEVPRPALPAQGLFGPKWWEGDALVAGESRGKIWRVRLVKTPHGYVGQSHLIARLDLLTVDLAISPQGDLYVCCHSGQPDWGTGPQGDGRIFRIRYTDPLAPQPVAIRAAGKDLVQIDFDRPLDPSITNGLAGSSIRFGAYVSAGDQLETLKPPYAVVDQQAHAPVGQIPVLLAGVRDWDDSPPQTLILQTVLPPVLGRYALTLPSVKALGSTNAPSRVDLDYDLSGAELWTLRKSLVARSPKFLVPVLEKLPGSWELNTSMGWFGTLPHPELETTRSYLGAFAGIIGSTTPATEARADMVTIEFRPRLPTDAKELIIRAKSKFEVGQESILLAEAVNVAKGGWKAAIPVEQLPADRTIKVFAQKGAAPIRFSYSDRFSGRERPLGFGDSLLPFAPTNSASAGTDSRPTPKPQGDWEHGRELFHSPALNCAKCHRIRGEGGLAGPDLSNLIHRDARSVERDIREPNATLHPDYVTYRVELKTGDSLLGFVRAQDDNSLRLLDANGQESVIKRDNLVTVQPTGQSLMPSGLLETLTPNDVRDLLTYLLWEPPVRAKAETERVPSPPSTESDAEKSKALRLILVASKQDHGPGQHDYPRWQEKWLRLLAHAAPQAVVEKAWEWPSAEQFATADVLVFYFWNHDWSPARYAQLDAYQHRGGGVVILHSACIADRDAEQLAERIGLSAQPDKVGYRHMPFDLHLVAKGHPLLQGLPEMLSFLDEPYWPLIGDPTRVTVLATGRVDEADRPLIWTFERGPGRVFGSILGHYFWTLDDPLYRLLVLRGIAWAGGADLNRLTDAAKLEAAVK